MIPPLAPHLYPCIFCGEPCETGPEYANGFGPFCSTKHADDFVSRGLEPTYKHSSKCKITSREALRRAD